jgi:hypothetical protein
MVQSPGDGTSLYAPTNEREQGGVVAYSMVGTSDMVKRRRDDAYKKMHEACNGPYRIVAETATGLSTEATSAAHSLNNWYIQFACSANGESASKPPR